MKTKLERIKGFRNKVAKRYESNLSNPDSVRRYVVNLLNLLSDNETHKGIQNLEEFKWVCTELTLWNSIACNTYNLMLPVSFPSSRTFTSYQTPQQSIKHNNSYKP